MYRDSTEAEGEGEGVGVGVTEVVTGVVFEAAAAEDTVLTGATVAVAEDVATDYILSWSLRTPSSMVVPICLVSYTFPL